MKWSSAGHALLLTLVLGAGGAGFPACAGDPEPSPERGDTAVVDLAGCAPGEWRCIDGDRVLCLEGGETEAWPCDEDRVCSDGQCIECPQGKRYCEGQQAMACGAPPTVVETCSDEAPCHLGYCTTCVPQTRSCELNDDAQNETWECQQTGPGQTEWVKTATCPVDYDCIQGYCVGPCSSDFKLNTNQGCDYYAVDLENIATADVEGVVAPADAQFAVAVVNPSETTPMTVTVHETHTGPAVQEESLGAGELRVIGLGPRNVAGSMMGALAWRIRGSRPFVAYQFNPLDNTVPAFSSDASMLLPVNALSNSYLAITERGGGPFVTVVASRSNTEVTVRVTAATVAGEGVPALQAGETFTTTLGAGELVNLRALAIQGGLEDLTGTEITATGRVVVFSGNRATETGPRCCADHLEQQLLPVSSWGNQFVAGRSRARSAERDHWRILAGEDDTTVSIAGGVEDSFVLDRGEHRRISAEGDFVVTATGPILVGQVLASSQEVLSDDQHCTGHAECASGLCRGFEYGTGRCAEPCAPAPDVCPPHRQCLAGALIGQEVGGPGGVCVNRPCGEGLPDCPEGSSCVVTPGGGSFCYEGCEGTSCASGQDVCSTDTPAGALCLPLNCPAAGCGDGHCMEGGTCAETCVPAGDCPVGHACLPVGVAPSSEATEPVCVFLGCTEDSQCEPGHTCVIRTAGEPGLCEPIGDPALIVSVAVEQYRDAYTFLVPDGYKEDYVNVMAPAAAQVTLDGAAVDGSAFVAIGDTGFKVARLPVADGVHRLSSTAPVGAVIYGYDDDVSYGYPAGANLFDLKE